MKKKLTNHFTLEEMTRTDTGLPNNPDKWQYHMLLHTATILERVRSRCRFPIKINSGFRSSEVNKAVGGVSNSLHLDGRAVDIDVYGMSACHQEQLELCLLYENPVEFETHPTYIHVAY